MAFYLLFVAIDTEVMPTTYECPFCQNVFRVDGDDRYVECPYCGETLDTEELDNEV